MPEGHAGVRWEHSTGMPADQCLREDGFTFGLVPQGGGENSRRKSGKT